MTEEKVEKVAADHKDTTRNVVMPISTAIGFVCGVGMLVTASEVGQQAFGVGMMVLNFCVVYAVAFAPKTTDKQED